MEYVGWSEHKASIKKVKVSTGFENIIDEAFSGCTELVEAIVPQAILTTVGNNAFKGCSKLSTVQNSQGKTGFPDTVTSIGSGVFDDCPLAPLTTDESGAKYFACSSTTNSYHFLVGADSSITSCEINDQTVIIAEGAFKGHQQLTRVVIPGSAPQIPDSAFLGCSGLKTITIIEGVTSIGSNSFKNCEKLEEISIPKSVTSIGNGAFDLCCNLETITIPASVNTISNKAFAQCSSLKTVSYLGTSDPGKGLDDVFDGCDNLEEIKVPSDYTDTLFCGRETGVSHSFAILDSKPTKWFITFITLLVCYLVM